MGRIAWACVVVAVCAVLAVPALAQTNQACVLRCLDRGHLDQYCQGICTNGVPAAAPVAPNRSSAPAQQPAPQSAPLAVQPNSPVSSPETTPPASSSPVQSVPAPAQNVAPEPAQNEVAPQPAAQSAPQQVAKPPAPPVNQMCVLHCLDHGHLSQYCDAMCTVKRPTP